MGYFIECERSTAVIKEKDYDAVADALQTGYWFDPDLPTTWFDSATKTTCTAEERLASRDSWCEILEDEGLTLVEDLEEGVTFLEFEEGKGYRLNQLLSGLSPWISGDMEFRGEDGERWLLRFEEGDPMKRLVPKSTTTIWE